jgi:hypothetical protein
VFSLEQLANHARVNNGQIAHGRRDLAGAQWDLISEATKRISGRAKIGAVPPDEPRLHCKAAALDFHERGIDAVEAGPCHAPDDPAHHVGSSC